MDSPTRRYDRLVRDQQLSLDLAQRSALQTLETLHAPLAAADGRAADARRLIGRLLRRRAAGQPAPGVYLWGGVGRGKTLVMDLFFQSLPIRRKLRTHFHRFMNRVHAELRRQENQAEPLERVAKRIARQTRVICFDEFFVSDITDAMILGTLMDALFRHEVTLVATSNVPPEGLYRDGLQRARFLPAIDLLCKHTRVVHLDGGVDYRLRVLRRSNLFQTPPDELADHRLRQYFADISGQDGSCGETVLEVLGRSIPAREIAGGVAWFDFSAICDGPRSPDDYIEIARCHHTVIVSNVPQFDTTRENQARRFIALVDEFYDRRVKLILSAQTPVEALYQGQRLRFEFQRTVSRLQAMQSYDYLAAEHRP